MLAPKYVFKGVKALVYEGEGFKPVFLRSFDDLARFLGTNISSVADLEFSWKGDSFGMRDEPALLINAKRMRNDLKGKPITSDVLRRYVVERIRALKQTPILRPLYYELIKTDTFIGGSP